MKIPVLASNPLGSHTPFDLILDGLIGYSLKGEPRGKASQLIEQANQSCIPILALDTPPDWTL